MFGEGDVMLPGSPPPPLLGESVNEAEGWSDGGVSDSPLGFPAINNTQTDTPAFSLLLFLFFIIIIIFTPHVFSYQFPPRLPLPLFPLLSSHFLQFLPSSFL